MTVIEGDGEVLAAALRGRIAAVTPARLLTGRAGTSYPTSTLLALRADSAAARDAVSAPLETGEGQLGDVLRASGAVQVRSRATSLREHLRRPDLGRLLSDEARETLTALPDGVDLQVVVGDGLSARALSAHVPTVLPALLAGARDRGWSVGRPVVVELCRVGVINDIGALLRPRAVVLLIGERPGLAYAESMSAYLAWDPRPGQTDADRVVLSGISASHRQGLGAERAAPAILDAVAARWPSPASVERGLLLGNLDAGGGRGAEQ